MPLESLPMTDVRAVGALGLLLVVLYWTFERLAGEARDPVIRHSMRSETGTASILVSGTAAVMVVAGLAAALLLAPVGSGPVVESQGELLAALAVILVVHWWFEKEERET